MRRLIPFAPMVILSGACAFHEPTTALYTGAGEPDTHALPIPANRGAIEAWRLPDESPWSRYQKLTLLTYLETEPPLVPMYDVRGVDLVRRTSHVAAHLATVGLRPDTLWIVDLPGPAAVAFGAALSELSPIPIAPVITFNNWPAENEVVPAERTLSALVSMWPKPLDAKASGAVPVFLLDSSRLWERDLPPSEEAIDNRYALLPSDVPDAPTLQAMGITHVVYLVGDRTETPREEDDLHERALEYQNAGLGLSLVGLTDIERLGTAGNFTEIWARTPLIVLPRSTVLTDPAFYARARGGFGGVHAAPVSRVPGVSGVGHVGGLSHFGGGRGG